MSNLWAPPHRFTAEARNSLAQRTRSRIGSHIRLSPAPITHCAATASFLWHISVAMGVAFCTCSDYFMPCSVSARAAYSADLPTRKSVNLAAIKTMVAAAEAEAKKLNVEVTICIVDESGNLLFLQKAMPPRSTPSNSPKRKAPRCALQESFESRPRGIEKEPSPCPRFSGHF